MVEHTDSVLVQVRDVRTSHLLGVRLKEHPAEVRVQKTLADRVGILVGVGVAVVSTVAAGPPADGALNSTSTDGGEIEAEGKGGLVAAVSPKTVVA